MNHSDTSPQRILLFGGTFDPPHRAHVELPQLAAEKLQCDRIVYIPAAINPLKRDTPPTDDEHRLNMLRLAIQDLSNAEISTIELQRGGASYFVETVQAMRQRFGEDADIRFLIGADSAAEFHKWKNWQHILELATPVVMLRPPWDRDALRAALREVHPPALVEQWMSWLIDLPMRDISATEIRQRMHTGNRLAELLDPKVIEYIYEHHLYMERSATGRDAK